MISPLKISNPIKKSSIFDCLQILCITRWHCSYNDIAAREQSSLAVKIARCCSGLAFGYEIDT